MQCLENSKHSKSYALSSYFKLVVNQIIRLGGLRLC